MADIEYPPGCQPITLNSNNNELIKRLRAIADALHDCPPNREFGEKTRFLKLFQHLSNSSFMNNSNRDVQIYLAICLASILRLFSPEMPATVALQLKEQYLFIFRVLNTFGDVTINSPMFKRYHYLVEVIEVILHPLSEMKDLNEEETLPVYRSLIKAVLSIPCGKGWDKSRLKGKQKIIEEENEDDSDENEEDTDDEQITLKIMSMMTSICVSTLHDLDQVPIPILDVLFFYIVEPQKSNYIDACRMSRDILQKARNQIEPSLQDVLRQSMMFGELSDGFDMTGSANRAKLFDVIKSLYQIDSTMVSQAISFLCRWLESENSNDRQQAVRLVGSLTRERSCQFGVSTDDPTWRAYMKCAIDEDADVRKEFVRQSICVLTSIHSHLRGSVSNSLLKRLNDADDSVRETTINTIIQIAKIKLEAVSEQLLNSVAKRMLDHKVSVRLAAVKNLMSLYNHVMTSQPQIECLLRTGTSSDNQELQNESTYTDSDRASVAFIPKSVFKVYRLAYTMPELIDSSALISRYFQLYFVSYKCEPKQRMELMAKLMRNLDAQSITIFRDIIQTSSAIRKALIGICQEVSKKTDDNNAKMVMLKLRIRKLSKIFSDSAVIERVLMRFVNQMSEDEQTFEHVKYLISDDYTSEGVQSNSSRLIQRSIERKTISAKLDPNSTAFRRFMDRCSPLIMDSEAASCLVDLVSSTVIGREQKKKQCEENYKSDLNLLEIWTDHFAHVFTNDENVEKIRKNILSSDDHQAVETGLSALNSIFSISGFRNRINNDESRKKWSDRFIKGLTSDLNDIIMRDEPEFRRSSKLAVRLLKVLLGQEKATEFCDQNIDTLVSKLETDNQSCANKFQVLAEIFAVNPTKYSEKFLKMIGIGGIVEKVINCDESEEDLDGFRNELSLRDHIVPASSLSKIYALKMATKVLIESTPIMRQQVDEELKNMYINSSNNFIEILSKIVKNKGIIDENSQLSNLNVQRGRLRGTAATCLMKLCIYPHFREKVEARTVLAMSFMVLDEDFVVRIHYVMSLRKHIKKCLPIDFAGCFALSALLDDENEETKAFKRLCFDLSVTIFGAQTNEIAESSKLQGSTKVKFVSEPVIAYLIWLLSHWPTFDSIENISALCDVRECIWALIEAQRKAKCDMQIVWQTIQLLRKYGDRMIRDENGGTKNNMEKTMEHNKKIWAMTELATYLMNYRAKIEQKIAIGTPPNVNRQYFYSCSSKMDLTETYIPDDMIEDEKQRNGRLPKKEKGGYFQQYVKHHTSTTSKSVASKNKKNTRSRKSLNVSNSLFEEDEDEIEEDLEISLEKSVYDIPMSDNEEEEKEKVPYKKKRSSGNDSNGKQSNGESPDKKRTKTSEELDNIMISPILADEQQAGSSKTGTTRKTRKPPAKLVSSTPFRIEQKTNKRAKRFRAISTSSEEEKNESEDEKEEEEEEEKIEIEESPKKARTTRNSTGNEKQKQPPVTTRSSRSRGSTSTTSPAKPTKKTSKKKESDVYDVPIDEDEPVKTRPKRKTRK